MPFWPLKGWGPGGPIDFDNFSGKSLDGFSYVPFWDAHMERMDLRLRAEVPQRVTIPGADLAIDLAAGDGASGSRAAAPRNRRAERP